MADSAYTADQLLQGLASDGFLDSENVEEIRKYLVNTQDQATSLPIKILTLIGAWLTGIFMLGFILLATDFLREPSGMIFFGILLTGGAIALGYASSYIFSLQLASAVGCAGHVLILVGFFDLTDESVLILTIAQTILTALIYPFFKDSLYRFVMPVVACCIALYWVLEEYTGFFPWLDLLMTAEILVAGVFLYPGNTNKTLLPLAYASAFSMLILLIVVQHMPLGYGEFMIPPTVIVALGCLALLGALTREVQRGEWFWIACGAVVLLAGFTDPGILAALGLLYLAYARRDALLLGGSFVFLVVFIVLYNYNMEITLDIKSYILGGSGLVLLGIRHFCNKRPWARALRA